MGAAIRREAPAIYNSEQHHCTVTARANRDTRSRYLQGTAGNMGMYAAGIPVGIITDRKSPRLAGVIGMLSLFVGYYPIHIGTWPDSMGGTRLGADGISL